MPTNDRAPATAQAKTVQKGSNKEGALATHPPQPQKKARASHRFFDETFLLEVQYGSKIIRFRLDPKNKQFEGEMKSSGGEQWPLQVSLKDYAYLKSRIQKLVFSNNSKKDCGRSYIMILITKGSKTSEASGCIGRSDPQSKNLTMIANLLVTNGRAPASR